MPTTRPLTSFKCLTFDCFGTLVDWESGIFHALSPLLSQLPTDSPLRTDRSAVLLSFTDHERKVQIAHPSALYTEILARSFSALAAELHVSVTEAQAAKFGQSVGEWPAFKDTVAALLRLKKYFKLVILSNVDRESFSHTLDGPLKGVDFDAIYTAQEIKSYKPDLRNFRYLCEHVESDLGVEKKDIIHTAQSLFHDVKPATAVGMTSTWIERGEEVPSVMGGKLDDFKDGEVDFTWRFKNMKGMADEADKS